MLAKNECSLYDVRFKMLRNKIKRERRSVNEQNVSNNLPSRWRKRRSNCTGNKSLHLLSLPRTSGENFEKKFLALTGCKAY